MLLKSQIAGVILGTAAGDSIGLPGENISRRRLNNLWKGVLIHRFFFGRGMCSDDTEHTIFTAQALLEYPSDVECFIRSMGWKFRFWLLGLPAGVGFATLRSIFKLWMGFSPWKSGVYSAGNGPAMRSALLGVFFCDRNKDLEEYVTASTQITHRDPKALVGALAVAYTAAWTVKNPGIIPEWKTMKTLWISHAMFDSDWLDIIQKMEESYTHGESVAVFASSIGCKKGVSGYIYQTVPVCLYSWLVHYGNFSKTIEAVIYCGGDTDTTGAIAGALAGASCGVEGIPKDWINGIMEFPRTRSFMEKLSESVCRVKTCGIPENSLGYAWFLLPIRNIFFFVIVLIHVGRRCLPPY